MNPNLIAMLIGAVLAGGMVWWMLWQDYRAMEARFTIANRGWINEEKRYQVLSQRYVKLYLYTDQLRAACLQNDEDRAAALAGLTLAEVEDRAPSPEPPSINTQIELNELRRMWALEANSPTTPKGDATL